MCNETARHSGSYPSRGRGPELGPRGTRELRPGRYPHRRRNIWQQERAGRRDLQPGGPGCGISGARMEGHPAALAVSLMMHEFVADPTSLWIGHGAGEATHLSPRYCARGEVEVESEYAPGGVAHGAEWKRHALHRRAVCSNGRPGRDDTQLGTSLWLSGCRTEAVRSSRVFVGGGPTSSSRLRCPCTGTSRGGSRRGFRGGARIAAGRATRNDTISKGGSLHHGECDGKHSRSFRRNPRV